MKLLLAPLLRKILLLSLSVCTLLSIPLELVMPSLTMTSSNIVENNKNNEQQAAPNAAAKNGKMMMENSNSNSNSKESSPEASVAGGNNAANNAEAAVSFLNQAVQITEKKVRNLEKRKVSKKNATLHVGVMTTYVRGREGLGGFIFRHW